MFTLSRATACKMMADIWRVVREWKVYFEGFGVAAAEIDKIAPAFRHIDDVSTPALRKLLSQPPPDSA
jgi:serine/threonine-protein kinase HipA